MPRSQKAIQKAHGDRLRKQENFRKAIRAELWDVKHWDKHPAPWVKLPKPPARPKWMDAVFFRKELVPAELMYKRFVFPEDL